MSLVAKMSLYSSMRARARGSRCVVVEVESEGTRWSSRREKWSLVDGSARSSASSSWRVTKWTSSLLVTVDGFASTCTLSVPRRPVRSATASVWRKAGGKGVGDSVEAVASAGLVKKVVVAVGVDVVGVNDKFKGSHGVVAQDDVHGVGGAQYSNRKLNVEVAAAQKNISVLVGGDGVAIPVLALDCRSVSEGKLEVARKIVADG